jgi:hypothetical protein
MRDPDDTPRYTVAEAAEILGTTTGAVRNRLSRGTLQSVKEGGTVYVLVPADIPRDTNRDTADTPGEATALISQMQARIDSLERQLELANERDSENRRIIAALTQRIPELEPAEAPETPTEEAERPAATGGAQEGAQRSWWRRMFGQ